MCRCLRAACWQDGRSAHQATGSDEPCSSHVCLIHLVVDKHTGQEALSCSVAVITTLQPCCPAGSGHQRARCRHKNGASGQAAGSSALCANSWLTSCREG